MSDSQTIAQALGDVLARAAWRYEVTHSPTLNLQPMPGTACLECECAVSSDRDVVARLLPPMWNACPKDMSTRERFTTLLQACFERGWRSSEKGMQ